MNAAAPQAPVSESGKNRKPSHGGKSTSALARGPGKGSAAFQQLLAARAARTAAALAAAKAHEAEGSLAAEAAGLKKALLALLKGQSAAHSLPGAAPEGESASVARKAHEESSRKSAHAKAAAGQGLAVLAAFGRAEAQSGAGSAAASAKERKAAAELDKTPAAEARPAAARAEPLVRIVDLRRHEKPAASQEAAVDRKTEPSAAADRDPSGGIVRFASSRETFVETAARPAPAAAAHPQTPIERLREMAGTELVRASTMVLRDGGGEIRLVLKPESLGSVRVRMNLVDNHIEGRIIVDSAAVKHVFDGSVDALRRALTAEGFQMGSLQVSVGGQDAQADQDRQDRQPPEAVRRVSAQGFERNVPVAEDVSLGDLFVNLFV